MYHLFFSFLKKVTRKSKLVTSQKWKESKKYTNDFINHFWKQDLSANNYLSNFADDLNVHKNSNVSKSSFVNIIADKLSSFDNNFLKLNGSKKRFIFKSSNSDFISISTLSINSLQKN